MPEQVASIRSFLRYAGRPKKFTVVSDGTYSARDLQLLRRLDRSVCVSSYTEWVPNSVPPEMRSYLTTHPTGRQLALTMSLPKNSPALYLDSDVLFFPGAASLQALRFEPQYLLDCKLSSDQRLFRNEAEPANPVNAGVLFLTEKLDWSLGIERFLQLEGEPSFFTNQTITHLAVHSSGGQPFDPKKFVLQLDDQFIYRDQYSSPASVLRHYVNPVRHKFWASLWS